MKKVKPPTGAMVPAFGLGTWRQWAKIQPGARKN